MSTRRGPRQSTVGAVDETAEAEAEIAAVTVVAAAVVVVAGAAGKNLQFKRPTEAFCNCERNPTFRSYSSACKNLGAISVLELPQSSASQRRVHN